MTDTCGLTFGKQLASFDRDLSSWRTCVGISPSDLKKFSRTLPTSGMTRSGELFELPTQAHRTSEQGSSLLPTPHAGLGERGRDGLILNPKGQQDLQHKIAHLLPTPTVVDMGNNKTPPEWEAWLQAMKTRHGNGNGHGKSLTQELIGVDTSQPSGDGKQ